jgi:hypothetical protein
MRPHTQETPGLQAAETAADTRLDEDIQYSLSSMEDAHLST